MKITFLFSSQHCTDLLHATVSSLAPEDQLTVIANTTGDLTAHGLRICPDLDAAGRTLSQEPATHPSHNVDQHLAHFGPSITWLPISDQEYARHIVRNQLLSLGYTLSQVNTALYPQIPPQCQLIPISDEHVETHVVLPQIEDLATSNSAIHVRQWDHSPELHQHTPERIVTVRLDQAAPNPNAVTAIEHADLVLTGPCDPVLELGPMVAIPGVRDTLQTLTKPVVWIAPPITPPTVTPLASNLAAIGLTASYTALITLFADFVSDLIITETGPQPQAERITCHQVTPKPHQHHTEFCSDLVTRCRALTRHTKNSTPTTTSEQSAL